MKKQIASLAVILLAVSSLAFNGCGGEGDADQQGDPVVPGEEVGADPKGGEDEAGEDGSDPEGSNP